MVQVKGPLMSESASGALAKTSIFTPWKGKHRVKIYRKPKNPRSTDQQTNRGFITTLVSIWQSLDVSIKELWNNRNNYTVVPYNPKTMSGYNRFLSVNLPRLSDLKDPYLTPSGLTSLADLLLTEDGFIITTEDNFNLSLES